VQGNRSGNHPPHFNPTDRKAFAASTNSFVTRSGRLKETETDFSIGLKGHYRIEDDVFVYTARESGRVITIFG
jgi:hypothetical protein